MSQREKDKLLFIGLTLPRYDKTAGGLRLFNILETLSKSYDIIFLPSRRLNQETGEEDRYRARLEARGIGVTVGDYPLINVLRKNKFRAAIIEFFYLAENYLPRIKILQPRCPVMVDTVDVHYARLYSKYQITRDMNDLQEAKETKKKELDIYKKADIVITVTEEDAGILLKDCPNLVLRTVPTIHHLIPPNSTPDRNGIVFVGGFSHDPNVDAVLYFCKDILPLIRKVIPDVKFTIVGNNPPGEIRALSSGSIIITGYVPSTTPYLQRNYISVAPLRYGAGIKGKIGEAMAHGLPVVTTSIGAKGMGLVNRKNAMMADSPESFAMAVIELIRDESLHRTIIKNGVEHVKNNYTDVQVGRQIRNILAELGNLPIKKISLSEKVAIFFEYTLNLAKRKLSKAGTQ